MKETMTSVEIRKAFFNFFEDKGHHIVPSVPIVSKDDPTLLFINAGMNQFKDIFLGNKDAEYKRVADTQKCLRVSGKHNDLEEVGLDSYHHTMFEMLGNWSFGDYFKKEAIEYAMELLLDVYQLEKDRLYVTVFEGDVDDGLGADEEVREIWSELVDADRILWGNKKDNFWEMGAVGPCGPCTEIHIDLRPHSEREKKSGGSLVNEDHPLVVELWNLVFIQYRRKADGSLHPLKEKHIDTGMGLERLAMAIQGKTSNYDTDLFTPFISFLESESDIKYRGKYGEEAHNDIAMRVVADHLRAVGIAIADGAIPANTGAGYVIRRILRRAVRYYYSLLSIDKPILYKMVAILVEHYGDVFPELKEQKEYIAQLIKSEEESFLKTLGEGLKRIEKLEEKGVEEIDGETAFLLYDTYGFPLDLTKLIAQDKHISVDQAGFEKAMAKQKERSSRDAGRELGDWTIVHEERDVEFIGYQRHFANSCKIIKYREVVKKGKSHYQLILDKTPFYAEGGGQVGDTGYLMQGEKKYSVVNTVKENDLIVHQMNHLPEDSAATVDAVIDVERRRRIENNHSATHLLHAALRNVLGDHVQQRGSLVAERHLRFDFSHPQALTESELAEVERTVNKKIRENIPLDERSGVSLEKAKEMGAMMFFGEKYGEEVRVITFDPEYSRELCGGCHVDYTGRIGLFKIKAESSVASGVRRIEAVSGEEAELYVDKHMNTLRSIRQKLNYASDPLEKIDALISENKMLQKDIQKLKSGDLKKIKEQLLQSVEQRDNYKLISGKVDLGDSKLLKDLTFQLLDASPESIIILAAQVGEKAMLSLATQKGFHEKISFDANEHIRPAARYIKGGGGGQPFYATAGGKNPDGLDEAIASILENLPS